MPDISRTFGHKEVSPEEREALIRNVFRRVAPRYDLMNDLMSMGIHRLWKRRLAREAAPRPGERIVDLAGGTGDVAALMAGGDRTVLVCDPAVEMMEVGRERFDGITWLAGTAEQMPLASASVNVLTIAFGIRNVTRIEDALAEIHRVLQPGGRFFCLEFSRPTRPMRRAYDLYSRTVIPRLGALVSGNRDAYHYLVESIRRFPDQEALRELIRQAGFHGVYYRNLSFGIACIHAGTRALDTHAG